MRRTTVLGVLLLVLVAAPGVIGQPAAAYAPPDRAPAAVSILPHARLVDGGAAIEATLRIQCVPNGTDGIQWEGFANVEQGDLFGSVELNLDCDGRPHTQRVVIPVSAEPGTAVFTTGPATIWAALDDENTLTQYAVDTRTVTVRAERRACLHR